MKNILAAFLCLSGTVFAQHAAAQTASSPNTEYLKNYDGTAGSFAYALNEREQMQVTYNLTPLHPGKETRFQVHSPDPMPFHATIINEKGKVVYRWNPEAVSYHYQASWDLSGLGSGTYTINLLLGDDKKPVQQIAFTR